MRACGVIVLTTFRRRRLRGSERLAGLLPVLWLLAAPAALAIALVSVEH
jgi:hypothetical protein